MNIYEECIQSQNLEFIDLKVKSRLIAKNFLALNVHMWISQFKILFPLIKGQKVSKIRILMYLVDSSL